MHLTFCSYKKLRTSFTNNYKYKQNIDSTITFSDKKPYLAISCNCCCRQYFLWRILFNTNDLGSFFRQFGSFLKMYDIYLKMYDIILLMYDINLKMYDIFLLMYAIYLKMYSIILLMYHIYLNEVARNLNRLGNYLNKNNKRLIAWAISLFVFSFFDFNRF